MGLRQRLSQRASALSAQAMEKLFADENRAQKVAEVFGAAQRGKAAFDKSQEAVMHQLQFATKADFKALGKRLSVLKKRVRSLEERFPRRQA
jgi:polyhydroxyalkanoate synthesis regulator phasin